jgi:hypothetical protein
MLTPEQARDLIAHFGGIHGAARAVGVSHTAIRYWSDPDWAEAKRAKSRRNYHANPEPILARLREQYEQLTGLEYNRLLLDHRRAKALARREKRLAQLANQER